MQTTFARPTVAAFTLPLAYALATACTPDKFVEQRCEPTHIDDNTQCYCAEGTSDLGVSTNKCLPRGAGGGAAAGGAGQGGSAGASAGSGGTPAMASPCVAGVCNAAPAPMCKDATTLRTFDTMGVCTAGVCSYTPMDTTCDAGCADGSCKHHGVTQIASGGSSTCAVLASGRLTCWGDNPTGQLGNGTTTSSTVPVTVVGLDTGVAHVASGALFTCASTKAGQAQCWGSNANGALGNGSMLDSRTPVDVSGLGANVIDIAAGSAHACAVTQGGNVLCWGDNKYGQLGNNSTVESSVPVQVLGLSGSVVAIAAGTWSTCAITSSGYVTCWGSYFLNGMISPMPHLVATDVSGLANVVSIGNGYFFSCAVVSNGAASCWGQNTQGQLGDGMPSNSDIPVQVVALGEPLVQISAGGFHACAVTAAHHVKCWGDDMHGELGDAKTMSGSSPVDVVGLGDDATSVMASEGFTCAALAKGGVKCWGDNATGQLGNGTQAGTLTPTYVEDI